MEAQPELFGDTARTQPGFLFDVADAPHEPVDSRTDAEREADLKQILAELRNCRDGMSGLRLAEITEHWRDGLDELERRGEHFAMDFIDGRFAIVRVKA